MRDSHAAENRVTRGTIARASSQRGPPRPRPSMAPWRLTGTGRARSVTTMTVRTMSRIEPSQEIMVASRQWLAPVREALGHEFLGAYLTGSVLTQGFRPERSSVNILVA